MKKTKKSRCTPERQAIAGAWIRAGEIHTGEFERRQRAFELCGEIGAPDSIETWRWIEKTLAWAGESALAARSFDLSEGAIVMRLRNMSKAEVGRVLAAAGISLQPLKE